jgi:outer membrane protein OmpA-like peptidoglycan-associated protein
MRNFPLLLIIGGMLLPTHAATGYAAFSVTQQGPGNPTPHGVHAEYYRGTNFEKKVLSRAESQVNYLFANQNWAPGIDEYNFSARWHGKLHPPLSGTYKLILRVDDGIRLWLGGKLLIDEWHGQSVITYTREVKLKAGGPYDLKIEYFNHHGPGAMQLFWEMPEETPSLAGTFGFRPKEIISEKYLFNPFTPLKSRPIAVKAAEKPARQTVPPTPVITRKPPVAKSTAKPPQKAARTAPASAGPPIVAGVLGNTAEKSVKEEAETFESLEKGKAVVLRKISFEQSRYILLPDSYAELDKLVTTLEKYPRLQIEIAGHTDGVGDPRLNQALSEHRAIVVTNYLMRKGIAENRLSAKGYGSSRPLAGNATEEERSQNRRVEFVIKEN